MLDNMMKQIKTLEKCKYMYYILNGNGTTRLNQNERKNNKHYRALPPTAYNKSSSCCIIRNLLLNQIAQIGPKLTIFC